MVDTEKNRPCMVDTEKNRPCSVWVDANYIEQIYFFLQKRTRALAYVEKKQ